MMSLNQTVYVVDDDPGVRESLREMLDVCGFQYQLFDSAESFLAQHQAFDSGCLILDLRLPNMDGLELQERLAKLELSIPVIMLSAHGTIESAVKSLQLGAIDFVQKPFQPRELLASIQKAFEKDTEKRRRVTTLQNVEKKLELLTNREKEILKLIVAGDQTKMIAQKLGTSQYTVSNQRSSIMKKMGAITITDLVQMVVKYLTVSV